MPEQEQTPQEFQNQVEKPTLAAVFNHLFTENSYNELKSFDPRNIPSIIDFMKIQDNKRVTAFILADFKDEEFAFRENIKYFDKLTASMKLYDLAPIEADIRGCLFNGHNLSDQIHLQAGEKFSGAAVRPASIHGKWRTKIDQLMRLPPLMNREEIVIGILDKEGKPKGLVYLSEGKNPRKRKDLDTSVSKFVFGKRQMETIPDASY